MRRKSFIGAVRTSVRGAALLAMAPIIAMMTSGCGGQTPAAAQQQTTTQETTTPTPRVAQAPAGATRTEHDLLGEKAVPADAYYGVQTMRALENFKISGIPINHYPGFIEGYAIVKIAAARANTDVGAMKKETLAAIEKAGDAILKGQYQDQFNVDWYQGGAGTSTNMNVNEVMANVALELTGHKKAEYKLVDPH